MNASSTQIWAIIPAAGIGQRMQSDIPKQYLTCAGKPVLAHSIERLLEVERVQGAMIALNPNDRYWDLLQIDSDKPVITVTGGTERADSVRMALQALSKRDDVQPDSLALVHDAVRPCVLASDIDCLIDHVLSSAAGGLLATRVKDTMKRSDTAAAVLDTVDRDNLWHALTPQLFRVDQLLAALESAATSGAQVTDEASAMELAGHAVQLIEASDTNLKITRPDDLNLAEFYLRGDS